MEFVVIFLVAFPYFALCRLLWNAGTYFRRKSRIEYTPEE